MRWGFRSLLFGAEMQRMNQVPPDLPRHTTPGFSAVCESSRSPGLVVIGISWFGSAVEAERRLHAVQRFRLERLRVQGTWWVKKQGEICAAE